MKRLTMNRLAISTAIASLAALLAVGCAAKRPPSELVDARAAYGKAQVGPATQANPSGLYSAKQSLDEAERKFHDDPGSAETRHLAYLAHRKAILAESQARTAIAQQQQAQAQAALAQLERARLDQGEGKAVDAQSEARAKAEQKAREAWQDLAAFAAVKDGERGRVITLSDSVLFATTRAELMPTAEERLEEVALAMKQLEGRKILIVGHTDNVGSDAANKELSQKRAEAVRAYFASHGVRPDLIRAEGHGEKEPISSNDSPETRASNRRVEIIIAPR